MSQSLEKKENDKAVASETDSKSFCSEQEESRAGLPNKSSIIKEKLFKSRSGKKYRIIKTSETDEYDKLERP